MKAAINAKNFLNMLKRVINFYWKKTLPPYPHEPPKNHFESEKKKPKPDWLKAHDVLLWHQSKNALKKIQSLKRQIGFICYKRTVFVGPILFFIFLILKGVFHISYSLCLWLFPNVDLCLKGGSQNLKSWNMNK